MPADTVKQKWDKADAAEATAQSLYWEVARILSERNEAGETKVKLAAEVGRGDERVGEFIRIHQRFGSRAGTRPTFNQALETVKGVTPESERIRKDASAARKVLRDPDERAKVIESMDDSERLEIAQAAMAPEARENLRSHKENVAQRESKPARERGVIELISAKLDMADLNILDATHTANETAWDDPEVNAMAEGRIDRTAMRLDLLRMAISGDGDIGAELARIEEES